MPDTPLHWVEDNEHNRAFHGKTVEIANADGSLGVFKMNVNERGLNGETNPGHVLIYIEPYDLDSALTVVKANAQ